jgi:hypothetical protein
MTDRHKTRKYFRVFIIFLVLLLLFGYTAYEIQKVAFGPRREIQTPVNGSTVSTSSLEISGIAMNIKDISMDDNPIFIDEKGNFTENTLLSPGYNTITFKADDKFGRSTEKVLEIIYKTETKP